MEISADIMIPVHAIAASFVILLGPVNMLRRRKDLAHRAIGRTWVVMMYLVCVSGMVIYTDGAFTLFHALAIFTFITTTLGVVMIRRGNVGGHIGNMIGSWAGAVVAGSFAAFVPGRYLPTLAVDDPALLWTIVAGVVVAATVWVAIVLTRFGGPRGRRAAARPARPAASPTL
jgi:uncharacterized membrane protein